VSEDPRREDDHKGAVVGGANEEWVPPEHGTETGALQKRVARGLTWTFIDTWGGQLVQLFIFATLAHLLTKVDFGLVALATVFVNFAQLFVDQGLGDALIQRKVVTRIQIDTAFWVAVVTGFVFMLGGFALAYPISVLVNQPPLAPIIAALSLTFLETSFSSVQMALLRRDMRFRSLAQRRLVAVVVAGVIGVGAAFAGWGAWALVANEIAYGIVSVFMLWTVSPWRPSFQWSRSDFRELFAFGSNIVGGDVLGYTSRNADNLLVGAVLGAGPLGLYAIGYKILDTTQTLLVNAARKLAFPVFSRIAHDPDRTRRAYGRVNRVLGAVILPGYIGLSLVAQEAIVIIFGREWAESGPVAATLYLIGPVLTLQVFSGSLLNAAGHPNIVFRFRIITMVTHVTGFVIAVTYFRNDPTAGIVAVAWAFVIGSYLLLPLNLYLQSRYGNIPVRDNLWQLRWIALSVAIMVAAVLGVKFALLGHLSTFALLGIEIITGVIVYSVAMLVFERDLVREVLTFAFQAIPAGDRVARVFGITVGKRGGRGKGDGKRRRNRMQARIAGPGQGVGTYGGVREGNFRPREFRPLDVEAAMAAIAVAESRQLDDGMELIADLGVDEVGTPDLT
jgi:O-antigen/teichoic acid export membrane protein